MPSGCFRGGITYDQYLLMSKVYTSYYGSRKLGDRYKVQISTSAPSYYKVDAVMKEAAPDWSTVSRIKNHQIDEAQYKIEYLQKLWKNKDLILAKLASLIREAGGKDVVLLCYEKPSDFCHRHLFMEWLEDRLAEDPHYKYIELGGEFN